MFAVRIGEGTFWAERTSDMFRISASSKIEMSGSVHAHAAEGHPMRFHTVCCGVSNGTYR